MNLEARDKILIITDQIKRGRVAGIKGNKILIEPRGVYWQPLYNNARMCWIDRNSTEIILHRTYQDEQKLIKKQKS